MQFGFQHVFAVTFSSQWPIAYQSIDLSSWGTLYSIARDGKGKQYMQMEMGIQGRWKRKGENECERGGGWDGKRIWHKPLCEKSGPCISAFAYGIAYSAECSFGTCFPRHLVEKANSAMQPGHGSMRFFDDDLEGSPKGRPREYNYHSM